MRNLLISALIGAALGAVVTKRYWPSVQVTEKLKIVTDTKVETKTVTKYVERPDGTKERIEFKDVNYLQLSKVDMTPVPRPDWTVGLLIDWHLEVPNLVIGRRVFGDVFVTGELDTKGNFRIGALIQF